MYQCKISNIVFFRQVLSLVQDLLPPVSELNNEAQKSSLRIGAGIPESDLPSPHYAWVESEHPYKPAGLWNYKVKAIFMTSILKQGSLPPGCISPVSPVDVS